MLIQENWVLFLHHHKYTSQITYIQIYNTLDLNFLLYVYGFWIENFSKTPYSHLRYIFTIFSLINVLYSVFLVQNSFTFYDFHKTQYHIVFVDCHRHHYLLKVYAIQCIYTSQMNSFHECKTKIYLKSFKATNYSAFVVFVKCLTFFEKNFMCSTFFYILLSFW